MGLSPSVRVHDIAVIGGPFPLAHLPGSECWSEPEIVTHLRAKQLLAHRFRGWG